MTCFMTNLRSLSTDLNTYPEICIKVMQKPLIYGILNSSTKKIHKRSFCMFNYSRLAYQLKREINNFSKKITSGLSRPKYKLVFQMLYGMLESQSTHLSKISRALKEKITLKKTIDRLSRNLNCFTENDVLMENYMDIVKKNTNDISVLIVDNSDVSKPCSKTLDSLCELRDGSTGRYTKGYHLLEITALTKEEKMPMPVYSRIYSSTEQDFVSQNEEVLAGLKHLTKHFGNNGIRTMDRGYDANVYYKYYLKNNEMFIIRATSNRNVKYKGKTMNILELANKYKGKYSLKFKSKKGETINCKISYIPISLPLAPKKELILVVVHGFGKKPMMLISNVKSSDPRLPIIITKVYLMRWRIEEYYRFKKQQFGFEDFRVQSLNSIRALNTILTVLIGLLSTFAEKQNKNLFIVEIIECSKRIYGKSKFIYYALGDGILNILSKTREGIAAFILPRKHPPSQQMTLFKVLGIKECEYYAY